MMLVKQHFHLQGKSNNAHIVSVNVIVMIIENNLFLIEGNEDRR